MELDFEIDKITESIEDAVTGESLETLGAEKIGANKLAIFEEKANMLIKKYFSEKDDNL